MSKKRKYDETYVSFGFTYINERDGTQKPQCFFCGKVLANGSMKPAKLKEHLMSIHSENVCKDEDFFRTKKAQFEKAGTLPKLGFLCSQKPILEASYKVAYRIAKQKKPYTIRETLVKPCTLEMVELVCGLEQRRKLEQVSLSNDIIHSRIVDMSCNILKQVIEELTASPFPFSMQLDESTDVSQCSQLLVFVRYVHVNAIKEEFLFCEHLPETTKAIDVFDMIKRFFHKQNFNWKEKLHSLCTDGAPAMLGNTSGFATLVKNEAPQVAVTHCFLHRHALATKTLPTTLKVVLTTAVKVVNFIRGKALNLRIFKTFCHEIGTEYDVILYHTEVRWLSKGKILKRLFKLRTEVSIFLVKRKNSLSEHFETKNFMHGLAYLADIFDHMNNINLALQGREVTIMDATEILQAFLAKLPIWKNRVEAENFANFPMVEESLSKDEAQTSLTYLKINISEHLETLQKSFKGYFLLDDMKIDSWIRNPFLCDINCIEDVDLSKDELVDLRTKDLLRLDFNSKGLNEFWCSLIEAYPRLAKRALETLVPFATTYFCESGFSTLATIKTKNRNRLDVQYDMRVALSRTEPQFSILIHNKQQQPSH